MEGKERTGSVSYALKGQVVNKEHLWSLYPTERDKPPLDRRERKKSFGTPTSSVTRITRLLATLSPSLTATLHHRAGCMT